MQPGLAPIITQSIMIIRLRARMSVRLPYSVFENQLSTREILGVAISQNRQEFGQVIITIVTLPYFQRTYVNLFDVFICLELTGQVWRNSQVLNSRYVIIFSHNDAHTLKVVIISLKNKNKRTSVKDFRGQRLDDFLFKGFYDFASLSKNTFALFIRNFRFSINNLLSNILLWGQYDPGDQYQANH